jgi:hypothetical protein
MTIKHPMVKKVVPKIWTADELRQMTAAERDALLTERTITDLSQADPDLVAWAHSYGRALLKERGLLGSGE